MTIRIVVVNAVVFLLLHIVGVVMLFTGGGISWAIGLLAMPSHLPALATRFWTPITYMFTQYDTMHALFNMLWLYWFGQIFMFSCTPRQLVALYVYGGLGGALLFLAVSLLLPATIGGSLLGASAAVIAIVIATAFINPDFPIGIFFIGSVKLKWLAAATLAIYFFGLWGSNAGGEVAHFGGAIVGAIYGLGYRRGRDITRPFCRLADSIANFCSAPLQSLRPKHRAKAAPLSDAKAREAELDKILDKIKKSGYSALTADEKRRLFDVSRKH